VRISFLSLFFLRHLRLKFVDLFFQFEIFFLSSNLSKCFFERIIIAGPQAMLQAATTYASFTYVIDIVFGSERKPNTGLNKEFDFTDTPIEERGY